MIDRQHLRPKTSNFSVGRKRTLVTGASTGTTELLGLAPPVVGNEQCAVVLDESLLELVLGVLVDVFLVVGDDGFGDGLTDGVDLRGVTSAGDAHANVDVGCGLCISMLPCVLCDFLSEGVCVPNLSMPMIRMGS